MYHTKSRASVFQRSPVSRAIGLERESHKMLHDRERPHMTMRTPLGRQVTGRGLQTIVGAVSPSILPGQQLDADQQFPTSFLADLFGPDEDWLIKGEEVGGSLLRELGLKGCMNAERALRELVAWFDECHPDATSLELTNADYRGADIALHVDYPPHFLLGIVRRLSRDTRAREVNVVVDDPYRFRVLF
jgi:hypothetical protein